MRLSMLRSAVDVFLKKQHTHKAVTLLPVTESCSHFLLTVENILTRGVVMDSGDEHQLISLVTWDNALYGLTPYYSREINIHVGCIRGILKERLLQES